MDFLKMMKDAAKESSDGSLSVDGEDFLKILADTKESPSQSLRGKNLMRMLEKRSPGSSSERKHDGSKQAKELEHVYAKSLTRIFKVADKLAAGPFKGDHVLQNSVQEVLPDEEHQEQHFEIGDRVVNGCSYRDFKYIQKKIGKWKKSMRNIYLQPGIVTDRNTTKDVTVQVYFPKVFSSCAVSTAVLKSDPNPEQLVERSQWKVGQYVQTRSHKRVVKVLMQRLPDIPKKYIGEPGRVIAVTSAGIFVTFDGLRSYAIDSALLRKSDREPIIEIAEKTHPRGLRPGDKVKVISQLKKLIDNQKGKGGWNRKMCSMAGKFGYITDINDDGTVDVMCGFGRSWRMNNESVLKMDEFETPGDKDELDLKPGNKVKVRMTEDLRMHLISKNIPLLFLEYLLATGEIVFIDDDFDAWVRFNSTSKICMQPTSLIKASETDAENFEKIQKKLISLKTGDTVYLDVGPPNYVRTVLTQHQACQEMVDSLTSCSIIVGWTDAQHAVIQYEDEKRYRVNKKYLTTPDRFDVQDEIEPFGLATVGEMQSRIENCVKNIHEEEETEVLKKSYSVDVYSMLMGHPHTAEFRIRSTLATSKSVSERLERQYGWSLEEMCPDTFMVKGLESTTQRVKMGLLFNDDIFLSGVGSGVPTWSDGRRIKPDDSLSDSKQGGSSGDAVEKFTPPTISDVKNFSLLRLHDASLSRSIYFPYVVHGPSRETKEQENSLVDGNGKRRSSSVSIENCNHVNFYGPSKIRTMEMM